MDKIHNPNDPDYDPVERSEEASRMREHVFKEIDTDKDKMISMDEFINATGTKEFEKNEEWRVSNLFFSLILYSSNFKK